MKFKVGDKVRVVKVRVVTNSEPYFLKKGVICHIVGGSIGVDFGFNCSGHSCGGNCPVGHGWYYGEKDIINVSYQWEDL